MSKLFTVDEFIEILESLKEDFGNFSIDVSEEEIRPENLPEKILEKYEELE